MTFVYRYRARFVRAIDGDTVELWVDKGFHDYTRDRFRLLGINAPEKREPGGPRATDYLVNLLTPHSDDFTLVIETQKADSFGRWLAEIYLPGRTESVSAQMLSAGHAVPYKP